MNNDKQTTEYLNKLKDIKLSVSSRERIEKNLLEYSRFHGVRIDEDSRSIEQVPLRTSLITKLFNLNNKSMFAAILTIALVLGGGTSYAAQGAVPGDFLYSVKTEVNENIKSALAVSDKAEARLQARLAEERLREAETLAARGELNAQAAANLNARLKGHYDSAEERSASREAKGDFETSAVVRASLEGSFRTYAVVLAELDVRISGNDSAVLINNMRNYADGISAAQTRATATSKTSVDIEADAGALLGQAKDITTEVATNLARLEGKISAEVYTRAEARLAEAVSAYNEAEVAFAAEDYEAAYAGAQMAIRIATGVKAMSEGLLKLEVHLGKAFDRAFGPDSNSQAETQFEAEGETEVRNENRPILDRVDVNGAIDVDSSINSSTNVPGAEVDLNIDTSVRSGLSL